MRPIITPAEARRLDEEASDPVTVLMERAGLAVALEAAAMGIGYGHRVAVLAGPGNNGGDGYVAAKYLTRRGAAVTVHALAPPKGASPAGAASRAAGMSGVMLRSIGEVGTADLVVDALFGAGFRGSLPPEVAPWTRHRAPLLAVDVPSGLDAETGIAGEPVFTATRTVTFQALKTGHVLGEGPDRCGFVRVADIGLGPVRPFYRLADDIDAPRVHRSRTAHKWSVGSVLVVGGSPGLTGAALFAAEAALNFGAGAAGIACTEESQRIYATAAPQILTHGTNHDAGAIVELARRYDALVVGPGLGSVSEAFVLELLGEWPGPIVVDADAINALDDPDTLAGSAGRVVITPHAGEFARLTGGAASPAAAAELAESTGGVVLLKGNPTHVCGREHWIVDSGGPELATIGTGDVLSGMIAALAAGGLRPEIAARSAAYHHGLVASRLASIRTLTARSLLDAVAWRDAG